MAKTSKKSTKTTKPARAKSIKPAQTTQKKKAVAVAEPVKKRLRPIPYPTQKPSVRTSDHKITGVFRLFQDSFGLVRSNWRIFVGIVLIYVFLVLVLLGGLGASNISEIRDSIRSALGGGHGVLTGTLSYALLVTSLGTGGTGNTAYQALSSIVVSLAVIWSLRQVLAGQGVTVRDAFYKGMYPLVPFILVLVVLGLQMTPILVVSFVLNAIIAVGLASSAFAQLLWGLVLLASAIWSVYMVSSTIFALYIVSLPDTRPLVALRAARELVRGRRWLIIRKLLFLPVALFVLGAIVLIPLIIIAPIAAQVTFLLLTTFALVLAHSYVYNLYRELL